METQKFSPKDAALIRKHPGASPDVLLALGLSKKAHARLLAATPADTATIEPVSIATIDHSTRPAATKATPKTMQLHNLRTGLVVNMSSKTATRLAASYPNTYKLL